MRLVTTLTPILLISLGTKAYGDDPFLPVSEREMDILKELVELLRQRSVRITLESVVNSFSKHGVEVSDEQLSNLTKTVETAEHEAWSCTTSQKRLITKISTATNESWIWFLLCLPFRLVLYPVFWVASFVYAIVYYIIWVFFFPINYVIRKTFGGASWVAGAMGTVLVQKLSGGLERLTKWAFSTLQKGVKASKGGNYYTKVSTSVLAGLAVLELRLILILKQLISLPFTVIAVFIGDGDSSKWLDGVQKFIEDGRISLNEKMNEFIEDDDDAESFKIRYEECDQLLKESREKLKEMETDYKQLYDDKKRELDEVEKQIKAKEQIANTETNQAETDEPSTKKRKHD